MELTLSTEGNECNKILSASNNKTLEEKVASPKSNSNSKSITINPMNHHHQELRQEEFDGLSSPIPKPNQVSTVLLYGIPIVSLYIESQERLCLAQISNTLLKQFSYNEIHNRRVALGITCVQCTPVQLEILRRAGAMPVSSRRCGMITRREAERLCKSFLGDNAPPRLPDDFAFSVHHKCAWGCRGSFLPSRYNSSRAKCIKCFYCGMFFSPNKFIFHSHRIGPGDKYIQPDAANFNSWRRHMKLSGNPPEEITHAWEDVKAMFNGGTRKRLLNTPSSLNTLVSSVTTVATGSTSSSSSSSSTIATQSPKRIKEGTAEKTSSTINSTVAQFPITPVNIHLNVGGTPIASNQIGRFPSVTSSTEITLPFSRNFMMDYMWHAHAQTKTSTNHFNFPNPTIPWIKSTAGSFIFGGNSSSSAAASPTQDQTLTSSTNPDTNNRKSSSPKKTLEKINAPLYNYPIVATPEAKTLKGFYNNSAFKPVLQANRSVPSYTVSTTTLSLETVAAVAAVAAAAATSYESEQKTFHRVSSDSASPHWNSETSQIKESFSSDDEMVDIETTEEEDKPFILSGQQSIKILKMNESKDKTKESETLTEVHNVNDELTWKNLLKKENSTNYVDTCRIQTPTSSILSHSPASSVASENHPTYQILAKSNSSTPDIMLAGSPEPQKRSSYEQQNSCQEQQSNVAAAIVSAFSNQRHYHQLQQNHHNIGPQSAQLPTFSTPTNTTNGNVSTLQTSGRLASDICSNSLFGTISNTTSNTNQSFIINADHNITNDKVIPTGATDEFWSVARLSLNRPQNELNHHHRLPKTTPFQRHHYDITKNFQGFRHNGNETPTHTNGVG